MFGRFPFAIGAVVLLLFAAGCSSSRMRGSDLKQRLLWIALRHAFPGSSVERRRKWGCPCHPVSAMPDDAMLARVFVEFPRLESLSIMDGNFSGRTPSAPSQIWSLLRS